MGLDELKNTWNKISSGETLDEGQLMSMLEKRTSSLIERVERNIRIGFGILLVLFLLMALDDFYLSPRLLRDMGMDLHVPAWLLFMNVFSYSLIFTTFVYFALRYYRVKRRCDVVCDLKNTLKQIIDTLKTYQRMFYLALVALTLTMALGFISGLYQETVLEFQKEGIATNEILFMQILPEIGIGFVFLFCIVGGVFLLLRWGFRRLYGKYYHRLLQTLNELEEID